MNGRSGAIIGALFFVGGLIITLVTYASAEGGGSYVVAYGAIIFGFIQMIRGMMSMTSEPVRPVPAQLISGGITADDYPPRAMREGAEGRVVVSFEVDERGTVHNAVVAESSGNELLDQAGCAAIERNFKFKPAHDGNGNPIPEQRRQAINWTLAD